MAEWIGRLSEDIWNLAVCCHYRWCLRWATSFWTKPFQRNINGQWQVLKGTLQGEMTLKRCCFFLFTLFIFFLAFKNSLNCWNYFCTFYKWVLFFFLPCTDLTFLQHGGRTLQPAPGLWVKIAPCSPRNAILFVIRQTGDGVHCGFMGGKLA